MTATKPLSQAAQKRAEKAEAIEHLRKTLPPGSTVHTVLRSVSSSGMSRHIDCYHLENGEAFYLTGWVAKALELRRAPKDDALVVSGCGMDMGFHVVYELAYRLHGGGYACLGKEKCPSNYHTNHRDFVHCPGFEGHFCYRPSAWHRDEIPEGWPRLADRDVGDGITVPGPLAACLAESEPPVICPTCQGLGEIPNPEGPERFDLIHTDGYALHHRWL